MIKEWNISNNINISLLEEYFKNNNNRSFLLDTSKKNFSYLEKIIHDIAMFHFERLNIIFDKNKHYIEFNFNNDLFNNN